MINRLLSILVLLSFSGSISAENYAFLISAGEAESDATIYNSEYWYDLFLVYEYLLLEEQYDSLNVFVFYGNGNDFNTSNSRYKKEMHNWGQITDYNNSYLTMSSVISSLNNMITEEDNILFYWVVGHGWRNYPYSDDDYRVCIENYNEEIDKAHLITMINSITHYKKRKIFWMTCQSGALGGGSANPDNLITTLVTSSSSNEDSYSFWFNNEPHSAYNFALFSLSSGFFPNGNTCNLSQVCYGMNNVDSLLSINELFIGINSFSYSDINSNNCPLNPCLFDVGGISNKIFIGERKELKNVAIDVSSSYWLERMDLSNVVLDENTNIVINADINCEMEDNVFVPLNATLKIE